MPRITFVVKNLIIINVLFLVFSFVASDESSIMFRVYQFLPMYYPSSGMFRPWQIVTHIFMHAGLRHLLYNMFGLFFFGSILEDVWGSKRFLIFYLVSGIGGLVLHIGVQALEYYYFLGSAFPLAVDLPVQYQAAFTYSTIVGASGAVFGLLAAMGYLFPNRSIYLLFLPFGIKIKYIVLALVCYEIFSIIQNHQGDMVAHFAHLGGALFGFILVLIWQKKKDNFY